MTETWDDYADRVRLRCERFIPWDYADREAIPLSRAEDVIAAAGRLDLRRIGDRRADETISALMRVAVKMHEETGSVEPSESVEGHCHAYAGEDRAWLAKQGARSLRDAVSARAKARREEALYEAAAAIASLRERPPAAPPRGDVRRGAAAEVARRSVGFDLTSG